MVTTTGTATNIPVTMFCLTRAKKLSLRRGTTRMYAQQARSDRRLIIGAQPTDAFSYFWTIHQHIFVSADHGDRSQRSRRTIGGRQSLPPGNTYCDPDITKMACQPGQSSGVLSATCDCDQNEKSRARSSRASQMTVKISECGIRFPARPAGHLRSAFKDGNVMSRADWPELNLHSR